MRPLCVISRSAGDVVPKPGRPYPSHNQKQSAALPFKNTRSVQLDKSPSTAHHDANLAQSCPNPCGQSRCVRKNVKYTSAHHICTCTLADAGNYTCDANTGQTVLGHTTIRRSRTYLLR
mmetsp:Transcript_22182/g.37925  ORF Transcript_22182/g.37925 Transcript_22182/m.37925 type:complete len:119 (-) Transcript_22182:1732-2088(-)